MSSLVYKIVVAAEWRAAERDGIFRGAVVDQRDGYIHFSTAAQVHETAARHFAGQTDLLLAAFDAEMLGPALKWEPSRGGALFYGTLDPRAAHWVKPLPLGGDGVHMFPPLDEG